MRKTPDDLKDLDRLLKSVQFQPRESLGAEVVGRWHRGERIWENRTDAVRRVFGLVGIVLLLGLGLFVFWLFALRPAGAFTVDRCCQDLDGGGDADDGLVVVSRHGTTVKRLAIYEDRDASRSYTPGDTIRFERSGQMALSAPLGEGARTVEFCCLDYDGGGPSDDALVVVGVPPNQISMAAIYERFSPIGQPVQLR
jgi:hypothetical protein